MAFQYPLSMVVLYNPYYQPFGAIPDSFGAYQSDPFSTLEDDMAQLSISRASRDDFLNTNIDPAALTKTYKDAERVIKNWLCQQPHLASFKYKEADMKRTDIEDCVASFRNRHIPIPQAIIKAFEDSIHYRQVVIDYYDTMYSHIPGAKNGSKDGHVFFLDSVKKWYKDLVSYAPSSSGVPASKLASQPSSKPRVQPALPKPVARKITSDDDEISALISKCKKQYKKAINTRPRRQTSSEPQKLQAFCKMGSFQYSASL